MKVALILAADVVYHEDSFAPLVHAFAQLAEGNETAPIIKKKTKKEEEAEHADAPEVAPPPPGPPPSPSSPVFPPPLIYLAYRRRCEPETAAHFFHMLDARFERKLVPWRWPSAAGGPPPTHHDAQLYRLTPRWGVSAATTTGGGGGGGGDDGANGPSPPSCAYCDMLRKARSSRLKRDFWSSKT